VVFDQLVDGPEDWPATSSSADMVEPLDILSPIDTKHCKLELHKYGKHRMGQSPTLLLLASTHHYFAGVRVRRFSETAPGHGDHS